MMPRAASSDWIFLMVLTAHYDDKTNKSDPFFFDHGLSQRQMLRMRIRGRLSIARCTGWRLIEMPLDCIRGVLLAMAFMSLR